MTDKEKSRYEEAKNAHAALIKVYPFTLENLNGEIWADIEGYKKHYKISTFGRIKSLKKVTRKF